MRLVGKLIEIHLSKIIFRRGESSFGFRSLGCFYRGRQLDRYLGGCGCLLHL
jgi:hypothetical protein